MTLETYLNQPVTSLKGIGPSQAKKLGKLGIFFIRDLLLHFPFRYDDLRQIQNIVDLKPDVRGTIKAKLVSIKIRRVFRRKMTIVEAELSDHTGKIKAVWFNQAFLMDALGIGREYYFSGLVKLSSRSFSLQNPVWELAKTEMSHIGRLVPVYPLTAGLYPKSFRTLIKSTLQSLANIPDYLTVEQRMRLNLPELSRALHEIHFPSSDAGLEDSKRRLSFDELYLYQLKIKESRSKLQKFSSLKIPFRKSETLKFLAALPFTLTPSQKKATWEIIQSLDQSHPASRLLAGDVGSGKTVVAALVCLQVYLSGQKSALMVPTEILASQHFHSFTRLPFPKQITIALLTSTMRQVYRDGKVTELKKSEFQRLLSTGALDIIIGTHSLIQSSLNLNELALVIVDEQHRFGVRQRAELQKKATQTQMPHFLSMTATPIPRSLALTLFGDLDVSQITELPAGRKPIFTQVIEKPDVAKAYKLMKDEITSGHQVFVACPLIDPSDSLGVQSVKEVYEVYSKIFDKRQLAVLHGRMKSTEKEKVLKSFAENKTKILISTTVIEVGIDFPNASIIAIHVAERFGLAQLHQLRGRVGRGSSKSYCLLLPEKQTAKSRARLSAMIETSSGLKLAEIDLQMRGPGDVYGKIQSGYPEFRLANIFDLELLNLAKNEVAKATNLANFRDKLANTVYSGNEIFDPVHKE